MPRNLRIGLLVSTGQTIDAFFIPIIKRWREESDFFVSAASGEPLPIHEDAHAISGLTRTPNIRSPYAMKALRRWVELESLDVVLTNTATASALARTSRLGVPVVYFCHGLHWNGHGPRTWAARFTENALLRNTDGIITINSDDESWFARRAPDIPRARLRGGVGLDIEQYPRTPRSTHEQLNLLWVGEFSQRKNPMEALRVAEALKKNSVAFELIMLGDGRLLAAAKQMSKQLYISDYVQFPGRAAPLEYLKAADVIIHTAEWEGLPRVLLEAVAVGRPIVGYDVKGVRDVPGIRLVPRHMTDAMMMAAQIAARQPISLPEPEFLSYEHAADSVATHLTLVLAAARK